MLEDADLAMWEFSARAIFDMWEVEQITGDPRNSIHLRSEGYYVRRNGFFPFFNRTIRRTKTTLYS